MLSHLSRLGDRALIEGLCNPANFRNEAIGTPVAAGKRKPMSGAVR